MRRGRPTTGHRPAETRQECAALDPRGSLVQRSSGPGADPARRGCRNARGAAHPRCRRSPDGTPSRGRAVLGAAHRPDPGRPIAAWNALVEIGGRGAHQLALAMRVARAAAGGGGRLTSHEEDEIARWFVGIVNSAIEATAGTHHGRLGGEEHDIAASVWYVLAVIRWPITIIVSHRVAPALAIWPAPVSVASSTVAPRRRRVRADRDRGLVRLEDRGAVQAPRNARYRPRGVPAVQGPFGADSYNSQARLGMIVCLATRETWHKERETPLVSGCVNRECHDPRHGRTDIEVDASPRQPVPIIARSITGRGRSDPSACVRSAWILPRDPQFKQAVFEAEIRALARSVQEDRSSGGRGLRAQPVVVPPLSADAAHPDPERGPGTSRVEISG